MQRLNIGRSYQPQANQQKEIDYASQQQVEKHKKPAAVREHDQEGH
jgi:hypothetical protein